MGRGHAETGAVAGAQIAAHARTRVAARAAVARAVLSRFDCCCYFR